ncbi:hypothetical protein BY996DRAFT_6409626 [Phakopsora pachyrhizi]|uniref:Uncharacterized protein n=1 Tax=Phakopsora pachyrhizi TaxID=170000 RepID=A0AAV0AUJ0_PHAPC|nr:hypothetical protein BY996DRAFT_6409626 [Phakopsora pachyrhizi]CAH7672056.1 hypothetical protein PPACK8108_LOCUS6837 [Phakopsora pachyrhizi]
MRSGLIKGLRRYFDSQISLIRLSIDSFNLIRAKLDAILSQQSTQKTWIKSNARLLPPLSKKFLDQSELNQSIILNLCLGSDRLLSSLDGLTEAVRIFKLAINTLESFKVQKQLKKQLQGETDRLDWLYPSRHWELLDSECLKVGPKERDYKEAYKRLDLVLQETMLNSLGLLKIVDNLLLRLDSPSINHNTKITLRAISNSLLDRVSEARKITESRYKSHREL